MDVPDELVVHSEGRGTQPAMNWRYRGSSTTCFAAVEGNASEWPTTTSLLVCWGRRPLEEDVGCCSSWDCRFNWRRRTTSETWPRCVYFLVWTVAVDIRYWPNKRTAKATIDRWKRLRKASPSSPMGFDKEVNLARKTWVRECEKLAPSVERSIQNFAPFKHLAFII